MTVAQAERGVDDCSATESPRELIERKESRIVEMSRKMSTVCCEVVRCLEASRLPSCACPTAVLELTSCCRTWRTHERILTWTKERE
eukprot:6211856-Pleurochrysis_carterae.AAC.1